MPRDHLPAAQAARALGISLDTLRRWDREGGSGSSGTARTGVSSRRGGRAAPRGARRRAAEARNRFRGVVRSVEVDGLLARVEIDVTEPARVVAIVTRESVEELGLRRATGAGGVVKSTSVMVER